MFCKRITAPLILVAIFLANTIAPATAQSFTEDEAVYIGRVTILVEVAAQSISDLQDLFANGDAANDSWWTDLAVEFGTLDSIHAQFGDVESPSAFSRSHRVLVVAMAALDEVALDGIAGVNAQDLADLNLVGAAIDRAVDDLQAVSAAWDEDFSAMNAAPDAATDRETSEPVGVGSGASSETVTIEGNGSMVIDNIDLEAGRYKVTATVEVAAFDGFAVWVYGRDGSEDLLFNDLIEEPGTWTSSQVLEVSGSGGVFLETTNTDSPWTLTFEPL